MPLNPGTRQIAAIYKETSGQSPAILRMFLNMPMSLIDLPILQEGRIVSFGSSLQQGFKHRLRELGFREGVLVRCLRKTPFGGPKVFEVGGSVFSIEYEVASMIFLDAVL